MSQLISYLKENKKEILIVALITLVALILRLIALFNYGDLWVDELWSFYFANKQFPFGIMSGLYQEDIHVPFFFLLLNLWIKLFGVSESAMRTLPLIFSVATIPVFYCICKRLFNCKVAYLATTFLAISSFHIYYAKDLKYYSLITLLVTLSIYYFIKLLNENDKKDTIKYIAFSVLSIWTFNVSIIFVFIQFIYGLFILFKKNKSNLKSFLLGYLAILICSVYVIITLGIRMVAQSNSIIPLVSHFDFDLGFVSIMVRNFFSNNLISVFDGYAKKYSLLKNISILNFITVLIPSLIGLFGLIKALFSKNKTVLHILISGFIFMVTLTILALNNIIMLLPRYLIMLLPAFITATFYGLSLIKNKKLFATTISVFLSINLISLALPSVTPLFISVTGHSALKTVFKENKINKNDIIFSPISGNLLRYYFLENDFVDFSFEKFYMHDSQKSVIFDDEIVQTMDKDNFREYFGEYILEEDYSKNIEHFLLDNYISKMKKQQKFVLIMLNSSSLQNESELQKSFNETENKNAIYNNLVSKFYIDTIKILDKNLKFKSNVKFNAVDSNLLIYEKE